MSAVRVSPNSDGNLILSYPTLTVCMRGYHHIMSCEITVLCQCPNIQAFVDDQSIECASRCPVCQSHVVREHAFEDTPAIVAFDLSQHQTSLLESVVITTVNGDRTTYKLRGVMYYLDNHFTSRFVSKSGHVWYHDGISTGRQMVPEGNIGDTELVVFGSPVLGPAKD